MNIDKIRHHLDRANTHAAAAERRSWLASLTPEHRAIHTGPRPSMCSFCINDAMQKAAGTVSAACAALGAATRRG